MKLRTNIKAGGVAIRTLRSIGNALLANPRMLFLMLGLAIAAGAGSARIYGQVAPSSQASQTESPITISVMREQAITSRPGEQVRFTASWAVAQMRLEVFSGYGDRVFDSDFKPGNILDWSCQNQQGLPVIDGVYRCVITARDIAGRVVQKHGEVRLQAGAAVVEPAGNTLEAPRDSKTATSSNSEVLLSIVRDGSTRATAALVHDGEKGRLTSGSGGLTFNTGDVLSGADVERMRLTPEGRLGIGVQQPKANLDVAGQIRTGEGILFPDGTVQTTAANALRGSAGKTMPPNAAASAASISGAGTTSRLTKWVDGPNGVIGDSTVTDAGGNVGVGTAAPAFKLDVAGSLRTTGPLTLDYSRTVLRGFDASAFHWFGPTPDTDLAFGIRRAAANNYDFVVKGNVGVGTAAPAFNLDVAGSLRTTGPLTLDYPRTVLRGLDASGYHWFGSTPDDLAFGIHRLGVNNYDFFVKGRLSVGVLTITGGSDLAEPFHIDATDSMEPLPGTVVAIDPTNPGRLRVANTAYDHAVVGIVSGAGGVRTGMVMAQTDSVADGPHPVALTGRVYCHADASYGPIAPGDLLTTSDTPGHAMKASDHLRAQGAIIGKAMSALKEDKGLVLVLVSLQ